MDDVQTLKLVHLFATMDDQEIAGVRAIMRDNHYAPGQTIVHENEETGDFHVIVDGEVEFLIADATGAEMFLDSASKGGFFGELSMLTGEPRLVRVRATEPVRTLSFDRNSFHDFLMKHPHAGIDVLTALSHRLYRTDKLLRKSVSRNVNEAHEEKQTLGQKIADKFAGVMGSWNFIIIQSSILAFWVIWNCLAPIFHWDEYPFIFLNLALSFQAAYAAPIIMMSQNRASDKDRLSAEIDHQVNIKAEVKTGLIMARLDDLERSMHFLHHEQVALLNQTKPAAELKAQIDNTSISRYAPFVHSYRLPHVRPPEADARSNAMSDDKELLQRAMEGLEEACEEVGRRVLCAAMKSAKALQVSATELVISDVTFKWSKLIAERAAAHVQSIDAFTQTMVWNYYRNWIRKQKSERVHALPMSSLDTSTQRFVDVLADQVADWPGARLEMAELHAIVDRWREKLSERDAQIVCLKEEGLDLGEIAARLNLTANAVTIVISRAKTALAEMLGIKARKTRKGNPG